jgi:soluble cytochrome b562
MLAAANEKGVAGKLTWDAINSRVPKGTPAISYDSFKTIFDQDPDIKKYVHGFDGTGIDLNTKKKQGPEGEVGADTKAGPNLVDKMAKSATKKAFS